MSDLRVKTICHTVELHCDIRNKLEAGKWRLKADELTSSPLEAEIGSSG